MTNRFSIVEFSSDLETLESLLSELYGSRWPGIGGCAKLIRKAESSPMLTGSLVRVRFVRNRIVPVYADVNHAANFALAEQLLEIFKGQEWHSRGEIEAEITAAFGDAPLSFLQQGLAKLLEDRCEFEVVAGHPPEQLRESVFRAAEIARAAGPFDRAAVLGAVAADLKMTPEEVDGSLFADLKSEQRMAKFEPITPDRLLQRYNVALAQSVLLKAVGVEIDIRGEPPAQLRRLFRLIKFHRLVCDVASRGPNSYHLKLDGPLSLFTATQKYGLQLALFLPAVLSCCDWELQAELRWGAERKPKVFHLSPADRLVSHLAEHGTYVPPELAMFAEQFRKKAVGWRLHDEPAILPLGPGFWVPDFRLEHMASGKSIYLEVLGFWRKSSAELHLKRLRQHAKAPFLVAVSDQLRIDDAELDDFPAEVIRFRQMPLPDEVMKRATAALEG
jgi:predicted nuclease of restriction endonuclease-like RecB superfamily